MKVKLSITLDDETIRMIEKGISSQRFRNRSHAVEFAIKKLLEKKTQPENQQPKTTFTNIDVKQKKLEVFANGRQ